LTTIMWLPFHELTTLLTCLLLVLGPVQACTITGAVVVNLVPLFIHRTADTSLPLLGYVSRVQHVKWRKRGNSDPRCLLFVVPSDCWADDGRASVVEEAGGCAACGESAPAERSSRACEEGTPLQLAGTYHPPRLGRSVVSCSEGNPCGSFARASPTHTGKAFSLVERV
jgi:hypothetical protein